MSTEWMRKPQQPACVTNDPCHPIRPSKVGNGGYGSFGLEDDYHITSIGSDFSCDRHLDSGLGVLEHLSEFARAFIGVVIADQRQLVFAVDEHLGQGTDTESAIPRVLGMNVGDRLHVFGRSAKEAKPVAGPLTPSWSIACATYARFEADTE